MTTFVPLWPGLPPNITLAVAVALAVALALKVSESPLIGPGCQPLSLWSCYEFKLDVQKQTNRPGPRGCPTRGGPPKNVSYASRLKWIKDKVNTEVNFKLKTNIIVKDKVKVKLKIKANVNINVASQMSLN